MVRATEPAALIVAHGQPSAPEGPETAIAALARTVAAVLPGWRVRGATLAAPGSHEAALTALGPRPVPVYPHFMADGSFVRQRIPKRLAAAGRTDCEVLAPFGRDPASRAMSACRPRRSGEPWAWNPPRPHCSSPAHGSPSDPQPAAATRAMARAVGGGRLFQCVAVGFVDESPSIAEAARRAGATLCLPFFAARNGHVAADVPATLAGAIFAGPPLDPIVEHSAVPQLIAAALAAAFGRAASVGTE